VTFKLDDAFREAAEKADFDAKKVIITAFDE
jgi:hypothetical protein